MEVFIKQECEDTDIYSEKVAANNYTFVDSSSSNHFTGPVPGLDVIGIDLRKIKKEKDEEESVAEENEFRKYPVFIDFEKSCHLGKVKTEEVKVKSENEFFMTPNYSYDESNHSEDVYKTETQKMKTVCASEVPNGSNVFDSTVSPLKEETPTDEVQEDKFNILEVDNSKVNTIRSNFCESCKKQFDNQEDFNEHLTLHNSGTIVIKEIFECDKCGDQLCDTVALKEHMKTHSDPIPVKNNGLISSKKFKLLTRAFQCSICDRGFTYSSNLKRHMQLHTGEKPFKCTLCNKGFRERHSLKNHMPVHFKEKRVKCEVCGKLFFHENYLQKHMVVHNKKRQKKSKINDNNDGTNSTDDSCTNRPLFCLQCKIQFDEHEDYAIHVISHNPQTTKHKKRCNECGEQFHSTKKLEKHMAARHSDGKPSKTTKCKDEEELTLVKNLKVLTDKATGTLSFICKICNEVFDRSYKLRDHMNVHDSDKSYKCNECGRKFASIPYLRKHSVIHATERPHQCGICNRGFHRRSNLEIHMRTHFNDRPYKCTKCDKTFTSLSGLNRHNKIHDGPYNCPVCNKKFNSESLKIHMLLHTGEKSFACHICNKRFAVSNYLKVHIRVKHTGERPYQCPKCDKNYTQSAHLRSHMKVHHGDVKITIKKEIDIE